MKLSERLEAAREALDSMDDFARMEVSIDPIGPRKVLADFIEAAAELARRVEDAEIAEPAMQSGHLVSVIVREGAHYKGQRLRLVPEDGQGGGDHG